MPPYNNGYNQNANAPQYGQGVPNPVPNPAQPSETVMLLRRICGILEGTIPSSLAFQDKNGQIFHIGYHTYIQLINATKQNENVLTMLNTISKQNDILIEQLESLTDLYESFQIKSPLPVPNDNLSVEETERPTTETEPAHDNDLAPKVTLTKDFFEKKFAPETMVFETVKPTPQDVKTVSTELSYKAQQLVLQINRVITGGANIIIESLPTNSLKPVSLKNTRGGIMDKDPKLVEATSNECLFTIFTDNGEIMLFPNRRNISGDLSYNNYFSVLFDGIEDERRSFVIEEIINPAIMSRTGSLFKLKSKGLIRVRDI